ncbi:MAG: SDR family oxidoreductase [Opitutaceae bacterium]|nr:SDR family oxidoreductase [Opitutaceae bacterium]
MDFPNRFSQRTAIITGGGQGIGRAVADRLAREGARVGILDRDQALARQTAAEMTARGLRALPLACDITDDAGVAKTFAGFAESQGGLDVVVHAAAIVGPTGIETTAVSTEDFVKVCNINLVGSFIVAKHALAQMKSRGRGRILLIASIAGKEGNAGMACYSATKAGVIGLVKSIGKEFAETGITINALAPATIRTAMVEAMPPQQVKYMTDRIPMKRCGTVEEAAALAAWVVSDEASFNTGFTFDLTGGRAVY